jgi:hypothetical protein
LLFVLAGAFHLWFNWRADVRLRREMGLARLRARGIEASAGTPMKDLAERQGRRPHDLVEILAGA